MYFLATGEYDKTIAENNIITVNQDRIIHSPYMICSNLQDGYYDYTRQQFLCDFLNAHYLFKDKDVLEDNNYRINIELLIYTHIWEARTFLKRLSRFAHLLCEEEYNWKMDDVLNSHKSKFAFIKNEIIEPFNKSNHQLGKIIESIYNRELRNAIAHSDYRLDGKSIGYGLTNGSKNISLDDWSVHFAFSFCLSYHLSDLTKKRRQCIGESDRILFKQPLLDGAIKEVYIKYDKFSDRFHYENPIYS